MRKFHSFLTKRLQSTLLLAALLVTAIFHSGCSSYYIRGGHTTPDVDFASKTRPSNQRYRLNALECGDFPNPPTHQEIVTGLMEKWPNRFAGGDNSDSAILFDVRVTKPTEEQQKFSGLFGWRMISYWLSLGVFPGSFWIESYPAVDLKIYGEGTSEDSAALAQTSNGAIKLYVDSWMSCWTPLGLIFYGPSDPYFGDVQRKGMFTLVSPGGMAKDGHDVHVGAIVEEINAQINRFESQSATQSPAAPSPPE